MSSGAGGLGSLGTVVVLVSAILVEAAAFQLVPIYVVGFTDRDDVFITASSSYRDLALQKFSSAFEVCVKMPYSVPTGDGSQPFCVDTESTSPIEPFYIISGVAKRDSVAAKASCLGGELYLSNTFYLGDCADALSCECDTSVALSGSTPLAQPVVGTFSTVRSATFSRTLTICKRNVGGKVLELYRMGDSSCPPGTRYDTALYVVPVQPSCSTFVCPSNRICLSSSNQICDGTADCIDGEDEAPSMCCDGWYCVEENKCIQSTAVCDGTIDCLNSSSDEDSFRCFQWTAAQSDAQPLDTILGHETFVFKPPSTTAMTQCIRRALTMDSISILLADDNSFCRVYYLSDGLMALRGQIQSASLSGVTLYGNGIRSEEASFWACNNVFTCNGHGIVDCNALECTCDPGYYGEFCTEQFDMTASTYLTVNITLQSPIAGFDDLYYITRAASNNITYHFQRIFGKLFDLVDIADLIASNSLTIVGRLIGSQLDVATLWSALGDPILKQSLSAVGMSISVASAPFTLASLPSTVSQSQLQMNLSWTPPRRLHALYISIVHYGGNGTLEILFDGFLSDGRTPVQFTKYCDVSYWSCLVLLNDSLLISAAKATALSSDLSHFSWNRACHFGAVPISPALPTAEISNASDSFAGFLVSGIVVLSASLIALLISSRFTLKDAASQRLMSHGIVIKPPGDADKNDRNNETSDVTEGNPELSVDNVKNFLKNTFITSAKELKEFALESKRSLREDFNTVRELWLNKAIESSLVLVIVEACSTLQLYNEYAARLVKKVSRGLAVAVMLCVVLGAFLITFFQYGNSYTSNTDVYAEAYWTQLGDADPFSPNPFSAFVVPGESAKSCSFRYIIGYSPNLVFAAATCESSSTGALVHFRVGQSQTQCATATVRTVLSGSVVLVPLFGQNLTFFVKFTCATPTSIASRTSDLALLQSQLPTTTMITSAVVPLAIDPTRQQHWDDQSLAAGEGYFYRRVQNKMLNLLSSAHECRFDSIQTFSSSRSNFSVSIKAVVQTREIFYSTGPQTEAEMLLSQFSSMGNFTSISSDVQLLTPNDGDLPVGFVYGSSPIGADAARYYGIRGSFADIGAFFGDTTAQSEGDGLTISVYIKVSTATRGFVFGVTDQREDGATSTSPLLDQLIKVLASGNADWFNQSANVYTALYVNGPAAKLNLVYINSPYNQLGNKTKAFRSPLVNLEWDLAALGLGRLFNGAWHLVNIILRTENGQSKAQLVIDGQTSRSQFGWNQCVPRRPLAVEHLRTDIPIPLSSPLELSRTSGTLFVGYFAGAVAKLEFFPVVKDIFDVWLQSTKPIRDYNAISTTGYIVLGSLLFAAGVAFLGLWVYVSGKKVLKAQNEMEEFVRLDSFDKYLRIWLLRPRDWNDIEYKPVKRLMTTSLSPGEQLVKTLFAILNMEDEGEDIDLNIDLPTAEQLNMAVDDYLNEIAETEDTPFTEEDPQDIQVILQFNKPHEEIDEDRAAVLNDRGRTGATVDGGKLQFAQTQQLQTQKGDVALAQATQDKVLEMLAPIILTLQSVYVWLSNVQIPLTYHQTFGEFITVINADITAAFASIPPVATPLAQLFAGIAILTGLYFILHRDQSSFQWYLARYTLQRDSKIFPPLPTVELASAVIGSEAVNAFTRGEYADCDYEFRLPILSSKEAAVIEKFIDDSDDELDSKRVVFTYNDVKYRVRRKTQEEKKEAEAEGAPYHIVELESDTAGMPGEDVRMYEIGCRCPRHTESRLVPQRQSSIWPAIHRPSCCVEAKKKLCGKSTGMIFTCGEKYTNDEGMTAYCSFAVCSDHFHCGVVDSTLATEVLPTIRTASELGSSWIASSLFFFLANMYYTPFLKTALMILACNPYFQCMFTSCWGGNDQTFAVAVQLSFSIIVFYGIGFPLVLTLLLKQRLQQIKAVFFAPEYEGRFGNDPDDIAAMAEWHRFTVTDQTALGALYKAFSLRWIYLAPTLCAWKVILIIPPVFLESGTLNQNIGIAVVEFCYGLFWFVTDPSTAPIVDAMYKIGVVHQMIFLGFQNIDVHMRYHGSGSLTAGMIATTVAYLTICVAAIVLTRVAPMIQGIRKEKRIDNLLKHLGATKGESKSLYVIPEVVTYKKKTKTQQ